MLHTVTCTAHNNTGAYAHTTRTQTHTHVAQSSDEGWDDLLPVRLHTVPVQWVYKEMDPISGHAFNETQTETRF